MSFFSKLTKSEQKFKKKYEELQSKIKKDRKLMIPLLIMKIKEKCGVKTYTHNFFQNMWGGITNVSMAKENPFLVINRYPISQQYMDEEKPVIFQFGGSNPQNLAKAAKIVEKFGYDEININCGCPSPKVTKGSFGACLMFEPQLVADCVKEIEKVVSLPVSIKCRIGVDNEDSLDFLKNFIEIIIKQTKVKHFIIHSRKAFLKGLNPKQNRQIPPLIYERVFEIMKEFPELKFSINGGIKNLDEVKCLLDKNKVYGCMVGRATYNDIWQFRKLDEKIFGQNEKKIDREEILIKYSQYADYVKNENKKIYFGMIIKPLFSLFTNQKGTKLFKKLISDQNRFKESGSYTQFIKDVIEECKKSDFVMFNQYWYIFFNLLFNFKIQEKL